MSVSAGNRGFAQWGWNGPTTNPPEDTPPPPPPRHQKVKIGEKIANASTDPPLTRHPPSSTLSQEKIQHMKETEPYNVRLNKKYKNIKPVLILLCLGFRLGRSSPYWFRSQARCQRTCFLCRQAFPLCSHRNQITTVHVLRFSTGGADFSFFCPAILDESEALRRFCRRPISGDASVRHGP